MKDRTSLTEHESQRRDDPSCPQPLWLWILVGLFCCGTLLATAFVSRFDIEAATYKGSENWAMVGVIFVSVPASVLALILGAVLSAVTVNKTLAPANRPNRWVLLIWIWLGPSALIGLTAFALIGSR